MIRIIVFAVVMICWGSKINAQTTQPITLKEQQERIKKEKLRTPIEIDSLLSDSDKSQEAIQPLSKKEKRNARKKARRAKCRLRKNN